MGNISTWKMNAIAYRLYAFELGVAYREQSRPYGFATWYANRERQQKRTGTLARAGTCNTVYSFASNRLRIMSYMKEQRPGHTNNMIQANDNLRVATYKKLVLPESFAGYRTAPSVLRPPTEDWLQRSGSRHGSSRESPVLSVAALRRITELEIALSEEKVMQRLHAYHAGY